MHASSALMADVRRDAGNAQASAEPLSTALEHIEKRGSLLSLVPDRGQRLEWMGALTKQDAKYELTSLAANTLRRLGRIARACAELFERGAHGRVVGFYC
jgi:hypothetical protein